MENIYDTALEYFSGLIGRNIYAALAYGSRVAGYASEESDYDLIIIVEDYPESIKYYYESIGNNSFSALVVDKDFFEEDVYNAKHGEFVSGRLYTVFIPLVNEDYIRRCEISLKERTIIEEACDLLNKYGGLIEYLVVPLKFFLFSRLKRRMISYPPVRYSYIKTFFGDRGEVNTEMSLSGFRAAAERLVEKGVLERVDKDLYKISSLNIECPSQLLISFRYLYRGVKSYITHGRSAKVPPKVFIHEFQSKLRRGVGGEVPTLLRDPHQLLNIDGGRVSGITKSLYQSLKYIFGGSSINISSIRKTGFFSSTYIIDLSGSRDVDRIVRKHFSYLDIFKWFILQLWLIDINRFNVFPSSRFLNEVRASLQIRKIGVKSFEPILFSWSEKSIYSKYIEGVRVSELPLKYSGRKLLEVVYEIGRLVAHVHKNGFSFGDLKPNNIIFDGEELYITDLEQMSGEGDPSWDIAEYIYYTFIFFSKYSGVSIEDFVKAFISGYLDVGEAKYVEKASSIKYLRPFIIVSPPNRLLRIWRVLREVST